MVHRRKSDMITAGERAETRARAEAKKPVGSKLSNADAILAHPDIKPEHAAAVERMVARMARRDGDREELLGALGLGEVAGDAA